LSNTALVPYSQTGFNTRPNTALFLDHYAPTGVKEIF